MAGSQSVAEVPVQLQNVESSMNGFLGIMTIMISPPLTLTGKMHSTKLQSDTKY